MNRIFYRTELSVRTRIAIALLLAALVGMTIATAPVPAEAQAGVAASSVQVIVETTGDTGAAAEVVERLGGEVIQKLELIDGFVARLPESAVTSLASHPAIVRATLDGRVSFLQAGDDEAGWTAATGGSYDPLTYEGSMYHITEEVTEAEDYWQEDYFGQGVGVALIDSGVVGVEGLTLPGKIINGPDLSLESQAPDRHYLDTYGHGTHLAGIIAGLDEGVEDIHGRDPDEFVGMAPGAHIVSVKVADYEGSTDVSQVIAAIDWVVEHKDDPGLNIRVMNLSFGTDGTQSYQLDPLAFAVERAWASGIVVVVAAGNDGEGVPLRNPALDPYVISVGAADGHTTETTSDDEVPAFSSCGTTSRHVDLVAPGQSIVSLRNPGSSADLEHPEARVGGRFFLGSGTSQAAAVVSGAAALIISERPEITPDELKALLMDSATEIPGVSELCQGSGMLDLEDAIDEGTPDDADQDFAVSRGDGSLDAARGTHKLVAPAPATSDAAGPLVLEGEIDIFGRPFNSEVHAKYSWNGMAWEGGTWNGSSWSGSSWSGSSWSGSSWSGSSWSGSSWSGGSWSGSSWSGNAWNGSSWSGSSWSGSSWSGSSWSGSSWSGSSWSAPVRMSMLAQRIH